MNTLLDVSYGGYIYVGSLIFVLFILIVTNVLAMIIMALIYPFIFSLIFKESPSVYLHEHTWRGENRNFVRSVQLDMHTKR